MTIVHEVPTYIYALIDPRTEGVRYVGKTLYPQKRLHDHRITTDNRRVTRWIRELGRVDLVPTMTILETVPPGGNWQEAERRWIADYHTNGASLTNLTGGGDGAPNLSPESRAKKSASLKRVMNTPEQRQRMSEFHKAAWSDPDEHARRVTAQRIAGARPEVRERRRMAQVARYSDPDEREAQGKRMSAAFSTMEMRQKLSESGKASWADPARKEKRLEQLRNTQAGSEKWRAAVERRTRSWDDLARKERAREAGRARWADPAYRANVMMARAAAQEHKKLIGS